MSRSHESTDAIRAVWMEGYQFSGHERERLRGRLFDACVLLKRVISRWGCGTVDPYQLEDAYAILREVRAFLAPTPAPVTPAEEPEPKIDAMERSVAAATVLKLMDRKPREAHSILCDAFLHREQAGHSTGFADGVARGRREMQEEAARRVDLYGAPMIAAAIRALDREVK